ncbi:MAG: methionyl-tRNA formyltransferase [Candidatus Methylomirabilales bacterium]
MRLIFLGTPAFAIPSLSRLLEVGHDVTHVVTQPDRPAGRGKRLRSPAVKQVAGEASLPILQPANIRDPEVVTSLRATRPDVLVVVAFGQIVSRAILEIPPKGCLNVHASLLPKYRGPAPIPWALIRGETVTGVTIMEMVEAVDSGPILLQWKAPISAEDNAGTLHDRLAVLGADALIETLRAVERGEVTKTPQDEAEATYAPKLPPDLGRLTWSSSATDLWNLVRGLAPEPGAVTFFRGRMVRVLGAQPLPRDHRESPGTIVGVLKGVGIQVATGNGTLVLTTLQPEGKRVMTAEEFARGYRAEVGSAFASTREESTTPRPGASRPGRAR